MRLLYAYIAHFRNIFDQEMNFSSDYDISYSHEKLHISKLPEDPNINYLYGDSMMRNLSIIVGKTGAGKSNLLQLIGMQVSYRQNEDNKGAYLFLYELEPNVPRFLLEVTGLSVDGLYTLRNSRKIDFEAIIFTIDAEGKFHIEKNGLNTVPNNCFIFNSFDPDSYAFCPYGTSKEDRSPSYNSMISGVPRELSIYGKSSVSVECLAIKDYLTHFSKESIKHNASFSITVSNWRERIPVELPPKIQNLYWTFKDRTERKRMENLKKGLSYDTPIKYKKELTPKIRFLHDFLTDYAIYLRKYIHYYFRAQQDIGLSADYGKKSIVKRLTELCEFIDSNLSEVQYKEGFLWQIGNDIIDIYRALGELDDKYFTDETFSIPVDDIQIEEKGNNVMNRVFENIENYIPDQNNLFPDELLPYHWSKISSGEYQYGKVLGQIEEFGNRIKIGHRGDSYEEYRFPNIILLMDEPETFMHPEMCRQFIFNIDRYLKNRHPDSTFQMIISTHSPFMLSDVLSSQVIKMDYDDLGRCVVFHGKSNAYFAANLYSIMADGFFLTYSIGERARVFLQKKFEWLKAVINSREPLTATERIEISDLRTFIPHIGDEMIRYSFERLLKDLP